MRYRGISIDGSNLAHVDPLVQQFYTNPTIVSPRSRIMLLIPTILHQIQDFKNYFEHLITHVNPYTGISYSNDATIFAFETGNELGGPMFGDTEVPIERTLEIAVHQVRLKSK